MNKYGTVFTPINLTTSVNATALLPVTPFTADQRWDVDEIDINIGTLTNGFVRIGYGPTANSPMIAQWNEITEIPIKMKNYGVDNINQGAVNIYYSADAVQLSGQVGAHMVKQTTKKWIQTTSSAAFPARTGGKVISFGGNLLFMGGVDASTAYNDVWQSADNGVTWAPIAVSPFTARWGFGLVNFNNTLYVIGGYSSLDNSAPLSDVWSSSDGITWTNIQSNAGFSVGGHCAVVFNSKIFIYGGYGNAVYGSVWSSPDGINWTNITSGTWKGSGISSGTTLSRTLASGFIWNNKMWMLGGVNASSTYLNDVWSSTDGIQWLQSSIQGSFGIRDQFGALPFNQTRNVYVFGGFDGLTTYYNDVWYTLDNCLWEEENASPDYGGRRGFAYCDFNGSMWIIGGQNASTYLNDVWRSNVQLA